VLYRNETPNKGLRVKIVPQAAAEAALGCKLWVYAAGKLGQADGLIHYRQVFMVNGPGRSNVLAGALHVGAGSAAKVDLRVRFPAGVVREIRGAKTQALVTVREAAPAVAGR